MIEPGQSGVAQEALVLLFCPCEHVEGVVDFPERAKQPRLGDYAHGPADLHDAFMISSAMPSQRLLLVLRGTHVGKGQHGYRDGRGRPRHWI